MLTATFQSNHPPFHAAIIDLDGTMVDTLGDFGVALNLVLADMQLPPVLPTDVERMVGKGSEHLIRSTLAHVQPGWEPAEVEAAFAPAMAAYQRHYLAINGQHSRVYDGVVEGLAWLRGQGFALACLTNKPTAFALPLLAQKGLDGYFRHVFGGDAFARKKPDPLPLLKTCEALGTLPAHTLMVGDSSNDAQAARAAGLPGGAGDLWLQPRPACAQRGCRRLGGFAGRSVRPFCPVAHPSTGDQPGFCPARCAAVLEKIQAL
jgi:phosphoglycolate phosphatase